MARSDAPNAPSYRGLLALVITLGVLIVLGVIGLIAGAVYRLSGRAAAAVPYAAIVRTPGEQIEGTQLDGNRVLLRLAGPKGEELVIVDAGSGRVIGRIGIDAKP
jgi:hypothetical protein